MEINVKAIHFDATVKLQQFINKKVEKLAKYSEEIASADVNLQRVKPSLRLGGVFIARFNHRKLNKVVEQAVKSRYESITMKTRIRENIALAESAGQRSLSESERNVLKQPVFPAHAV